MDERRHDEGGTGQYLQEGRSARGTVEGLGRMAQTSSEASGARRALAVLILHGDACRIRPITVPAFPVARHLQLPTAR